MHLSDEVLGVLQQAPYLTLVTLDEDGSPHPIIVGGRQLSGADTVTLGIYKMEVTRKNLEREPRAWVLAATVDGGAKGCRLEGTAKITTKEVIFTPNKIEALI